MVGADGNIWGTEGGVPGDPLTGIVYAANVGDADVLDGGWEKAPALHTMFLRKNMLRGLNQQATVRNGSSCNWLLASAAVGIGALVGAAAWAAYTRRK